MGATGFSSGMADSRRGDGGSDDEDGLFDRLEPMNRTKRKKTASETMIEMRKLCQVARKPAIH